MEQNTKNSLERALVGMEAQAEALLKTGMTAVTQVKRLRTAARSGDLKEIRKALEASDQTIAALRQQFINVKDGWTFDEEAYLSCRDFIQEVLRLAEEMDLKIFELDDRLFCYPFLIRVLPGDRAVLIDKGREKRLRPSVLVDNLKKLQTRPVRFRPETFLDALFEAYSVASAARGYQKDVVGQVIPLIELYGLFTLMPGQAKDYSRQEFVRDVYLFDQSGITKTKKGYTVSLPASTGTKATSKSLSIITKNGQEKKYYGISFMRGE